jgi:endonuclease G
VPLPKLAPSLRQQVAPVVGRDDGLLHYSHYSVMMHGARRMAIYGVCNIDGKQWRQVPRKRDHWTFDPRLERAYQAGNELYKTNKLDRGHLVRRLDPAWGNTFEEAELAVEDTFFYTNCAPQHKEVNRDLWLGLEDHILGNADVHDLKVTVFNGPVFRATDRLYRGFKIPEDFWKVVVMVREDTGRLSATAYVLSQLDFMDDLEFAFGPYRTYQVPIRQVEELTDLDFGDLKSFDPLAEREAAGAYIVLSSLDDLVV